VQRSDDAPALVPLFDAIVERPGDDAPRQVLADALMERGDPRGEFIAVQLRMARGGATRNDARREHELFSEHGAAWLRELPGVTRALRGFHRGFPVRLELRPRGQGLASPTWRTVERLDVQATGRGEELTAPALGRLELVTGLDGPALQALLEGPARPRLREVHLAGPRLDGLRADEARRLVMALERFATLRVLELAPTPWRHHAAWLDWLFEARLARRLERLRLVSETPMDVAGVQAQLLGAGLETLKVELATPGVTFTVDARWLTVRFDDAAALAARGSTVRNLASRFSPIPYSRFEVLVGSRRATPPQLQSLGEVVVRAAG
jgi:uncharacterized protein (TIGR02996 family)